MPPVVITYSYQTLWLASLMAPRPCGFQTLERPYLRATRPCGFQTLELPYLRATRPCGFQTLGVHLEVCSNELHRPGGTWGAKMIQFPMRKAPVYKSHIHPSQCPLLQLPTAIRPYGLQALWLPYLVASRPWSSHTLGLPDLVASRLWGFHTLGLPDLVATRPWGCI